MDQLEVPDEAVETLKRVAAIGPYDQASAEAGEDPAKDARVIATPVVVAELRRLAAREVDPYVVARLQLRADKLEAGQ